MAEPEVEGDLVWHYTPWFGVRGIIRSGFIRGNDEYRAKNWNVPVVWFSKAQDIELTAGAGDRRTFYRVGFPADDPNLIDWPKLASRGRAKPGVRYHLERTGRAKGANPKDWCGVVAVGVSIEGLPLEMRVGDGWLRVKPEWVLHALEMAPEVRRSGANVIVGGVPNG